MCRGNCGEYLLSLGGGAKSLIGEEGYAGDETVSADILVDSRNKPQPDDETLHA